MALINFDAGSIEVTDREPIPAGTYEAVVVESEMKPTKNGGGMGINLTFELVGEGAHKGRRVWNWINYQHSNKEAERIGREDLARLCKAVGVLNLNDTVQLHNIPLMISVALDKVDKTRNVIRSYAPKKGMRDEVGGVSSGMEAPPWRR